MRCAHKMFIAIALGLLSMAAMFAQSSDGYELTGRVVASDAQTLSGGGYELSGTVTRPHTPAVTSGSMTASDYSLTGEFTTKVEPPSIVPCPGDLLEPSGVGVEDLLELLYSWGEWDVAADLDGDGVEITDLLELLADWGPCP